MGSDSPWFCRLLAPGVGQGAWAIGRLGGLLEGAEVVTKQKFGPIPCPNHPQKRTLLTARLQCWAFFITRSTNTTGAFFAIKIN